MHHKRYQINYRRNKGEKEKMSKGSHKVVITRTWLQEAMHVSCIVARYQLYETSLHVDIKRGIKSKFFVHFQHFRISYSAWKLVHTNISMSSFPSEDDIQLFGTQVSFSLDTWSKWNALGIGSERYSGKENAVGGKLFSRLETTHAKYFLKIISKYFSRLIWNSPGSDFLLFYPSIFRNSYHSK